MEYLIILATLSFFILSSTPIPIALGFTALICISLYVGSPLLLLGKGAFDYLDHFSFLAVLYFIVMGAIMTVGQSARRLINFANALVGFLPGGMAISVVTVCMLFGAISGSSIATLVAVGTIMVPALTEKGYERKFSVGLLTSAAELGILVPPSIPMIILALTLNLSVGRLFLAGYIPAILFVGSYSAYCVIYAYRNNIATGNRLEVRKIWSELKNCWGALLLIVIIAGGIYGGIFTASEAAAIGTVYALILELFFYRSLTLGKLFNTIVDASVTVGPLMFIVVGASYFGEFLTMEMIPQKIASVAVASIQSTVVFILMMNLLLLMVGMFLDMLSSIIIISPVLMPIASKFGIDPIHFAIMYIFTMGIGYITPPVGLDLYVSMGLFRVSLNEVVRACVVFFFILIFDLILIAYIEGLSTYLPNLIMGAVK